MSNKFNQDKKFNNRKPREINELKVKLGLSANVNEDLYTEIIDILAGTKFNKISIPVTTYRSLLDHTDRADTDAVDTRVSTIGYIRDYNADASEFVIIVYNAHKEFTKEYTNFIIEPKFTTNKDGSLRTITKFVLTPVEEAASEEE